MNRYIIRKAVTCCSWYINVHEHLLCTTWSSLFRCPMCLLRLVLLPHIISTVACVLQLPLWACHLLAITGISAPLLHRAVYEESSLTRHFTCLQGYAPLPHFLSVPCEIQSSLFRCFIYLPYVALLLQFLSPRCTSSSCLLRHYTFLLWLSPASDSFSTVGHLNKSWF
jgi:hypothetical protein